MSELNYETQAPPDAVNTRIGDVYLSVCVNHDRDGFKNATPKIEIVIFGADNNGNIDTSKEIVQFTRDGGRDDIEEALDLYKRRLESGVKPEELSSSDDEEE